MKTPEEQDDLWQLLGKAKEPVVSPFFARNVLREIRMSRQEKTGLPAWLSDHWRIASLGSVAAVLLALNATQLFVPQALQKMPPLAAVPQAQVPQVRQIAAAPVTPTKTDYEVIKNLDELVAYENHSIWLDDSAQ